MMETLREFTNKELNELLLAQTHIREAEDILYRLGLKELSYVLEDLNRKIGDLV